MKKLLALIIGISCLFSSNVSAYSIVNVTNNSKKYEVEFQKKIKFSKYKIANLTKLKEKIEVLINKIEKDASKTDKNKEVLLGKLIALNNMVSSEIDNRDSSADIILTIIDDKRCTNCMTNDIVSQLKIIPFLAYAKFNGKDFSDEGIQDYLIKNEIKKLPAVILSTNNIKDDGQMQPYLKELADKQYSLEIGASFDPFIKRSEKGFMILDKEILNTIKSNTYLKGDKDAKISWLEYSDLECPFCAKLHNSDVPLKIEENYGKKVNKYFNNFPLEFHKNAIIGAIILECIAEQKGSEGFYNLIDKAYKDENSDKDFLVTEAVKLGADKTKLEKCMIDGKYDKKINEQQSFVTATFGISGTPASILVNNDTGEYELISGAYPYDSFKTVIDKLLK